MSSNLVKMIRLGFIILGLVLFFQCVYESVVKEVKQVKNPVLVVLENSKGE